MAKTAPKTTFTLKTAQGHAYTVDTRYKDLTTVSAVIRAMSKDGYSRGEINRFTGIRYQHVRNVLLQPLATK